MSHDRRMDPVLKRAKELAMEQRCPTCDALPGSPCISPTGRTFPTPHGGRYGHRWYDRAVESLNQEAST